MKNTVKNTVKNAMKNAIEDTVNAGILSHIAIGGQNHPAAAGLSQSHLALHERALTLAFQYRRCEAELLDVIVEARNQKLYRHFGLTSIFEYCVQLLKLDPGVVYGFTSVAKKIKEVPELREKISDGSLNVSRAKRITSVLTPENKTEWFQKAEELPVRKLEQEVARENPKEEVKERASYLNSNRVKLVLGLEERAMLKLRRAQDLVSQKRRRAANLEEVITVWWRSSFTVMIPWSGPNVL